MITVGVLFVGFIYLSSQNKKTDTINPTPTSSVGEIQSHDSSQGNLPGSSAETSTNSQQSEIDNLKKEVEKLKNKKPQTIIKEVSKTGPDLALIVSQWQLRVAHVECKWYDSNGALLIDAFGSGLLIKFPNKTYASVLTNKHVITDQWGNFASTCDIKLPGSNEISTIAVQQTNINDPYSWTIWVDQDFDVGDLFIKNPTPYITSTASQINYCKKRASVGDQIVILGYPNIGSQTDITATEGIISGYDGGYYITSAKVERGNSGGATILLKDNCYLGIPSYVNSGEFESLGRILDFNFYYTTSFGAK